MHHIVFWKWNQDGFKHTYESSFVNIMADSVRRHSHGMPLRLICITDDPIGIDTNRVEVFPLWNDHGSLANRSGSNLPSCYRRLKLFDELTQRSLMIPKGDRIVSMDLDTIICGDLRPVLSKDKHFVGWAVRGTHHLRVFNGSMWMFTAGEHQTVWSNFDPAVTPDRVNKAGYQGSDQAWLSYNFAKDPTAGTWAYPQMVSYPKEVRRRPILSQGTAVVSFHGKNKPWHADVQLETPWVKAHWVEGLNAPIYNHAGRPRRSVVA